jgi:hypothetical protein
VKSQQRLRIHLANAGLGKSLICRPFRFEDVIIHAHGWSTNADTAMDDHDVFSAGLSRRLLLAERATPGLLAAPQRSVPDIGIHWPLALHFTDPLSDDLRGAVLQLRDTSGRVRGPNAL